MDGKWQNTSLKCCGRCSACPEASLDPKQLGHIVPVDVATLDLYTRRKVAEVIQTGYCF